MKALKAGQTWLRNGGGGQGDTTTPHRIGLRLRGAAAEWCNPTQWEGCRHPAAPQPSMRLGDSWAHCAHKDKQQEGRLPSTPSPHTGTRELQGKMPRRAHTTTALTPAESCEEGAQEGNDLRNHCQQNTFPVFWALLAPQCLLTTPAMFTNKTMPHIRGRREEGRENMTAINCFPLPSGFLSSRAQAGPNVTSKIWGLLRPPSWYLALKTTCRARVPASACRETSPSGGECPSVTTVGHWCSLSLATMQGQHQPAHRDE